MAQEEQGQQCSHTSSTAWILMQLFMAAMLLLNMTCAEEKSVQYAVFADDTHMNEDMSSTPLRCMLQS